MRFCSTKCCHATAHAGLVRELAANSCRIRVRDAVAASHGEYSTARRIPSALSRRRRTRCVGMTSSCRAMMDGKEKLLRVEPRRDLG